MLSSAHMTDFPGLKRGVLFPCEGMLRLGGVVHSQPITRRHSTGTFAFATRLQFERKKPLEMAVVQT